MWLRLLVLIPFLYVEQDVHDVEVLLILGGLLGLHVDPLFIEVDGEPPPPLLVSLFHIDQSSYRQEGQEGLWLGDYPTGHVLTLLYLPLEVVDLLDVILVVEDEVLGLLLDLQELLVHFGDLLVSLELVQTPPDDVLGVGILDPHRVEQHVVAQVEGTVEGVRLAFEHGLRDFGLHLLIDHQDGDPLVVDASSSGSPTHLDVLASLDPSEVLPVELPDGGEDDCLGGHVQPHGEGLGREEHLEPPLLEQQLDDFFDDRQQASVVHAYALLQDGEHVLYLGQELVLLGQAGHRSFVDLGDLLFLLLAREVELQHGHGIALHFLLRETEDYDRVEVLVDYHL